MLPKERVPAISALVALISVFSSGVLANENIDPAHRARLSRVRELCKSIEGPAKEPPRLRKAKDGYLRFLMAPPGAHFPVPGGRSGDTPEDITRKFLQRNGDLFLCQSPAVEFEVIRSKTTESRSNVHLRQTYSGIEVYGAEMIVQLDAEGEVFAVISDVMRDTETLDTGRVSLKPAKGPPEAQTTAIEFAASKYGDFHYAASDPVLMIYAPGVLGYPGDTQIVWIIDVRAGERAFIHEKVLVNAHTDEIALNYSLIRGAFTREIYDIDGNYFAYWAYHSEDKVDEEDIPTSHQDVKDAYDTAEDFYNFFDQNHGNFWQEYYNHPFADEISVAVRCQDCDAQQDANGAFIGIGLMSDDVLVHEFMHSMYGAEPFTNSLGGHDGAAMSESFGDLWGEWIDQTNEVGNDSNDVKWLLGEDYDWADLPERCGYDVGMIAVRCLYDPTRAANILTAAADGGASPARLSDRLGPPYSHYRDAGISNKLGYLLTDGTSGETNNAFNGYTFSGLEIPTTARLFFESLVLLPDSPDFSDLGCVMQLAAINNALTESQREIVEKACRAVEVYVVDSRFCVRNSSGVPVAWIDDLGNLVLTGSLTQNGGQGERPEATADDEFIFKDSEGNLAVINTTNGDTEIYGSVQQTWAEPSAGSDDFIIKDSSGTTVAYIDESGNLYLKGNMYGPES